MYKNKYVLKFCIILFLCNESSYLLLYWIRKDKWYVTRLGSILVEVDF